MFDFNKSKLDLRQKARLTKYLVFRLKHGTSVRKGLENYIENGRQGKEVAIVRLMLAAISAGDSLPDVFLRYGLINDAGHTIMESGVSVAKCLPVIAEMNTDNEESGAAIRNALIMPILMIFGMAILSIYFHNDLLEVFKQGDAIGALAGSKKKTELPFLVKHEYFILGFGIFMVLGYFAVQKTLGWMFRSSTSLFYRVVPWRHYQDWAGSLSVFIALQQSGQSVVGATKTLMTKTNSPLLAECFAKAHKAATKQGVRFSESFASVSGAVPFELHSFFVDADQTGETVTYLLEARDYCREMIADYQEKLRNVMPVVIKPAQFLVFGLMLVDLLNGLSAVGMAGLR